MLVSRRVICAVEWFNLIHFPCILLTGADSLAYLSVAGLQRAVNFKMKVTRPDQGGHCTACLTGEYPGGVPEELSW